MFVSLCIIRYSSYRVVNMTFYVWYGTFFGVFLFLSQNYQGLFKDCVVSHPTNIEESTTFLDFRWSQGVWLDLPPFWFALIPSKTMIIPEENALDFTLGSVLWQSKGDEQLHPLKLHLSKFEVITPIRSLYTMIIRNYHISKIPQVLSRQQTCCAQILACLTSWYCII